VDFVDCATFLIVFPVHLGGRANFLEARNGTTFDVSKFLGTIKRGCEQYAPKFATWESLFKIDGESMKKMGIACKQRRMILNWVETRYQPVLHKTFEKEERPSKSNQKGF
jgi:hypothetical protein